MQKNEHTRDRVVVAIVVQVDVDAARQIAERTHVGLAHRVRVLNRLKRERFQAKQADKRVTVDLLDRIRAEIEQLETRHELERVRLEYLKSTLTDAQVAQRVAVQVRERVSDASEIGVVDFDAIEAVEFGHPCVVQGG